MEPIIITKENFKEEVLNSDKPVLLDFWASWCGPCKMLSPVIDEIAATVDDVKFGKVNVDEQDELAVKFQVMSIPMLVLMNGGKVERQSIGYVPKESILQFIGK